MEIRQLTKHTGAEVLGIDLARAISPEARAALNEAFVAHSVLVVRDQSLTPAQMLAAVELFGPVFQQHNTRFALPDCPQIHYISNQDRFPDGTRYIPGEGWHTDHSNDTRPPKATVLHAVTLPDHGGDTQFANMAAAYSALPDALRLRIEGLMAQVKISIGGQHITSIITADAAREMQLKRGDKAAALIKSTEVMIVRV